MNICLQRQDGRYSSAKLVDETETSLLVNCFEPLHRGEEGYLYIAAEFSVAVARFRVEKCMGSVASVLLLEESEDFWETWGNLGSAASQREPSRDP